MDAYMQGTVIVVGLVVLLALSVVWQRRRLTAVSRSLPPWSGDPLSASEWERRVRALPADEVMQFRPSGFRVVGLMALWTAAGLLLIAAGIVIPAGPVAFRAVFVLAGFLASSSLWAYGSVLQPPFLRISPLGVELGLEMKIPWDAVADLVATRNRGGTLWYLCVRRGAEGFLRPPLRRLVLGPLVPLPLMFMAKRERDQACREIRRHLAEFGR